MRIEIEIDDKSYPLDVPETLCIEAADFFEKMDKDMNCGWQMSRWWVPDPDQTQRCQIVADKLLTSIMQDNQASAMLMAGYIALRMPGAIGVDIDAEGEMQNTELLYA